MSAPDDPLLRVPLHEDAGALTQARYGYQHNVAVPFCLELMSDSSRLRAVVCEAHEDFVLVRDQGPELVSVKHRELSRNPWSLSELLADSVGHLLSRWLATGRRARCRLMTNHGLKTGPQEAGALRDACAAGTQLTEWARRLAGALAVNEGDAAAFLTVLRIDTNLPSRDHVAAYQRVHALRPVLRALKLNLAHDELIYGRLLDKIAECSRDRTWEGDALIEALLEPDGHKSTAVLRRRLARRTLTGTDVGACFRGVATTATPTAAPLEVPPPTRLVQKLEYGGVGPTAVESAKELRADWYEHEARWRGVPGGGGAGEFAPLRAKVRTLAGEVESEVGSAEEPYGKAMHVALAARIRAGAVAGHALELDADLLLGLAFQLTDECEVWWSARFALT